MPKSRIHLKAKFTVLVEFMGASAPDVISTMVSRDLHRVKATKSPGGNCAETLKLDEVEQQIFGALLIEVTAHSVYPKDLSLEQHAH